MSAYRTGEKYKLDGRRVALIVCDTSRPASKPDLQYVLNFCKQNKFSLYKTKQFTEQGLMAELKRFKETLKEDVCCLTLFIMAHGNLGHIKVSNGQIDLERIFEVFDNRNCPALRGKPKLFVIQACRGVKQCSKQPCFDASEPSGELQMSLWPLESDVLFVYAVCPGKLAIGYPDTGSPLLEEMNNVFSQSDSMSMFDLFTKVNGRLEKRKQRDGFQTDRASRSQLTPQIPPRRATAPMGGPLHIVDRLTQKWYL